MSDHALSVIILAAGAGTRMRSRTPKVLHELGGMPMIGHVVTAAKELQAATVVAVVRHERELVERGIKLYMPSIRVVEQDAIPGTGRAAETGLQAIVPEFEGDVLIVSGDVPLLAAPTLRQLIAAHRSSGAAATILTATVDDPTGFGRIIRGATGGIDAIVEQKDATDEQRAVHEINSGTYVVRAGPLREALAEVGSDNAQHEKYLTDVIELLSASGQLVGAEVIDDPWLIAGVNDRVQLAEVAAELNRRTIRTWQLAGVTVDDPGTTWIDATVTLDEDVTLLPGTQLKGTTVVHRGATVGPDTTVVDSEIGADAVVVRTHAIASRIGRGAAIGPFANLRPGTVVGSDGKIGSFVETKNASIGTGTKVPHLSYIGDAEIGEHSNIGAGTIFANYDGVNKHRSSVGSYARTGSHNVFVSPITIGDGAYTGAGTVVRSDVPPGALGLSAAPQRNVEGWVLGHRAGTAAADAAEVALNGKNGPDRFADNGRATRTRVNGATGLNEQQQ